VHIIFIKYYFTELYNSFISKSDNALLYILNSSSFHCHTFEDSAAQRVNIQLQLPIFKEVDKDLTNTQLIYKKVFLLLYTDVIYTHSFDIQNDEYILFVVERSQNSNHSKFVFEIRISYVDHGEVHGLVLAFLRIRVQSEVFFQFQFIHAEIVNQLVIEELSKEELSKMDTKSFIQSKKVAFHLTQVTHQITIPQFKVQSL
jgi:hypothetical protein